MSTPKEKKFYMPPEWHPHTCCWMQWPYNNPKHDGYGTVPSWSHFDFDKGRLAWSNVANSISKFSVICRSYNFGIYPFYGNRTGNI